MSNGLADVTGADIKKALKGAHRDQQQMKRQVEELNRVGTIIVTCADSPQVKRICDCRRITRTLWLLLIAGVMLSYLLGLLTAWLLSLPLYSQIERLETLQATPETSQALVAEDPAGAKTAQLQIS
jgi:hypothetical protein